MMPRLDRRGIMGGLRRMGAIGGKERGRLQCPAPPIVAGASRQVLCERDVHMLAALAA